MIVKSGHFCSVPAFLFSLKIYRFFQKGKNPHLAVKVNLEL
jgi:hypothetical protein